MNTIHLLTGNLSKIKFANTIFHQYSINIEPLQLDIPEIQAETSQEIATHAAVTAYERSGKPVIREDHSFYIDDLGMPGPFMAYIDKTISVNQLLRIIDTLPTRNGHFILAATYVDANGQVHEFSYKVPVVLSSEAHGDNTMRWERVIQFPEETRTFAEYPESERTAYWTKNYEEIAKFIQQRR